MHPRPAHFELFAELARGPRASADAVSAFDEEDAEVVRSGEVAGGDEAGETGADDDDVVGGLYLRGGSAGDD